MLGCTTVKSTMAIESIIYLLKEVKVRHTLLLLVALDIGSRKKMLNEVLTETYILTTNDHASLIFFKYTVFPCCIISIFRTEEGSASTRWQNIEYINVGQSIYSNYITPFLQHFLRY